MDKIKTAIILEILGRPENYLKDSLKVILDKLKTEQGVKIINTKTAEPKKIGGKDFFSAFAEVEFEADNLAVLVNLMFRYMPAHIEVISPEKLDIKNAELNSILNDLILKLHRYDELAKILSIKKNILAKQLIQLKQQLGIKTEQKIKPSGLPKEQKATEKKKTTKEKKTKKPGKSKKK